MPKKTLALITGLVLVTVILFVIALKSTQAPKEKTPSSEMEQPKEQMQVMEPSPTIDVAHSVLSILPDPVNVLPGQKGEVSVNIDTADNAVTAIQLEIAYDPNIITNVKVMPGPLFQNPVVLIDKDDKEAGRYTFAFGITPNRPTVEGIGSVANISFTAQNVTGQQSQLALLPTSLVTARGISSSVLKTASGTLITVGASGISN